MTGLTLYGDCISGNCMKTRWTADLLGVDYTWVDIDVVNGGARTEEFLRVNPFGQAPTAALADGRVLAQSNAILIWLAETSGSDLLPADPFDRAKVHEWLFWEQYSHEPYIAVRRFQKAFLGRPDAEIPEKLMEGGLKALKHMERALLGAEYLAAGRLTLADIALVAYTRVAHEGGFDLAEFPNVRAWIARVEREIGADHIEEAA